MDMVRRTFIITTLLLIILCQYSTGGVSIKNEEHSKNNFAEDFEKIKKELLERTDSALVSFFYMGGSPFSNEGPHTLSMKLSGKNEVAKIINIISNEDTPRSNCGYSGEIDLLDKEKKLIVKLKYNTMCAEVIFEYKGHDYCKEITPDGNYFIKELRRDIKEP